MSGHLPVIVTEGPLTRTGAVRAGTVPPHGTHDFSAPPLPPLRSQPLHEVSSEREDELKDVAAVGESDAEVEEDTGEDDSDDTVARQIDALREEEVALKAQRRLDALRQLNFHKTRVARLRDEAARAKAAADEQEARLQGHTLPDAAAAPLTPSRSLSKRSLHFPSAVSRRTPSAASVARQAAVDSLPLRGSDHASVSVSFSPVLDASAARFNVSLPARDAAAGKQFTKGVMPEKFTGDDEQQNERVYAWVQEVNRYIRLTRMPAEDHLDFVRSLFPSKNSASEWVNQREAEADRSGRKLTWEWLQEQLVEHYARTSGEPAMEAEWLVLRMGVKSADGNDTGKSTRSVASYTRRFLYFMRHLTDHDTSTTDLLTIDRYVQGIKLGYPALHLAMMNGQIVMRFATLEDAIRTAELAESNLANAKTTASAPSYAPGRFGGAYPRGGSSGRVPTESLNNLEGETSDGDEGREGGTAQPRAQLNGFRFITQPDDGRYKLSEKEQHTLYDERRCFRCYGQHPVGRGHPACTKPPQKAAPRPLSKN